MASAYAAADLVISRSGAVTVVETGTLGIYSAYVPLPIGNGEQSENARYVVLAGGGELVANESFTAEWLLSNVDRMIAAAESYREADKRIDFPPNASNEIGERSLRAIKGARHE
jgi:UDP-N-acetylglucosamine--N-acetylmuramyl-(pentapeptide) pyrophosphoryl-undecaprenol N-acetylglucosamine transferase